MWEAGEIVGGGGGREAYNAKKSYIFHSRKGLKGGRQEKKGQDPEMQGTECGRYGPPVGPPPHYFSDLDMLFVCVIFWDKYRNFTYVTLTLYL